MDGVRREEQAGEGGEGRPQSRHAQTHPGEQDAGGCVQHHVRRVEPRRLQSEHDVVRPEMPHKNGLATFGGARVASPAALSHFNVRFENLIGLFHRSNRTRDHSISLQLQNGLSNKPIR